MGFIKSSLLFFLKKFKFLYYFYSLFKQFRPYNTFDLQYLKKYISLNFMWQIWSLKRLKKTLAEVWGLFCGDYICSNVGDSFKLYVAMVWKFCDLHLQVVVDMFLWLFRVGDMHLERDKPESFVTTDKFELFFGQLLNLRGNVLFSSLVCMCHNKFRVCAYTLFH